MYNIITCPLKQQYKIQFVCMCVCLYVDKGFFWIHQGTLLLVQKIFKLFKLFGAGVPKSQGVGGKRT